MSVNYFSDKFDGNFLRKLLFGLIISFSVIVLSTSGLCAAVDPNQAAAQAVIPADLQKSFNEILAKNKETSKKSVNSKAAAPVRAAVSRPPTRPAIRPVPRQPISNAAPIPANIRSLFEGILAQKRATSNLSLNSTVVNTAPPPASFSESLPTITEVTPNTAVVGSTITITGSGFGIYPADNTYNPEADGNKDGIVNQVDLGILAVSWQCKVSQSCYNPTADFNKDQMTDVRDLMLLANSWLQSQPNQYVSFGNTFFGAKIISWTDTQIQCVVPWHLHSENYIVVVKGGQESNFVPFTVIPQPEVVQILPDSMVPGDVITVYGFNFGVYPTDNTYNPEADGNKDGKVDKVDLGVLAVSWQCKVGQGCYNPAADFNKDSMTDARDLLLLANSWLQSRPEYYVLFANGVWPKIISWTDSEIKCVVPWDAQSGNMFVKNPMGASNATNVIVHSVTPIFYGESINAEISSSHEADVYKFNAQAGDKVIVDVDTLGEGNSLSPKILIYDQDRNLIAESFFGSLLEAEITSYGNHYIWIKDSSSNTGAYIVKLESLNHPSNPTLMNYGDTFSGAISSEAQMNAYQFDGQAGDHIIITASQSSNEFNFNPRVRLYDQWGSLIQDLFLNGEQIVEADLEVHSKYYIWISSYNPGAYTINLQSTNRPLNTQAISYGDSVTASTTLGAQVNVYSFNGQAGDQVVVSVISTILFDDPFSPAVKLYDQNGDLVSGHIINNGTKKFNLINDGNYHIWIADHNLLNIGSYNLNLQSINRPGNIVPISYGNTLSGAIPISVKPNVYQFVAQSQDQVIFTIRKTSGEGFFYPRVQLYDQGGNLLSDISTVTENTFTVTLASAGNYYMWIFDNDLFGTGTYNFNLQSANQPLNIMPIDYTETISAAINSICEVDFYTFNVDMVGNIKISLDQLSGVEFFNPSVRVFDSTGALIAGETYEDNGVLQFAAPRVGSYYVWVNDDNFTETGTYAIKLDDEFNRNDGFVYEVSITPSVIDLSLGETANLNFKLQESALVNIVLYRIGMVLDGFGDGEFFQEFVDNLATNESRPAGVNSFSWNIRDSQGNLLPPSVYRFVIRAKHGGQTSIYEPPYVPGSVSVTGKSVSPSSYNPYANEAVQINYTLSAPAWVTIGGEYPAPFPGFIVEGQPRLAGANTEIWDGRAGDGNIFQDDSPVTITMKTKVLPEVSVIVKGSSIQITNLKTNPYLFFPTYNEITKISYTINRQADITIRVVDPNGNSWTISQQPAQNAGSYELEWSGVDANGDKLDTKGNYRIEVIASEPATNTIVTRSANIAIYR